jgi:hypothetical protein
MLFLNSEIDDKCTWICPAKKIFAKDNRIIKNVSQLCSLLSKVQISVDVLKTVSETQFWNSNESITYQNKIPEQINSDCWQAHAGTRVTDTNHASESVKRMLARKKLSSLINLDVLDELEKRSGGSGGGGGGTNDEQSTPTAGPGDVKPDVAAAEGEENEVKVVGGRKRVLAKEKQNKAAGKPLGVVNAARDGVLGNGNKSSVGR